MSQLVSLAGTCDRTLMVLRRGLVVLLSIGCRPPAPAQPSVDASAQTDSATRVEVPNEPLLATVGDVEVPQAEFDEILALKLAKYTERGREVPESALRRYEQSIARRLIWQAMLAQECERLGIDYDSDELKARWQQQRHGFEDFASHLRRRGETEESLEAMFIAELRERAILRRRSGRIDDDAVARAFERDKQRYTSTEPFVEYARIDLYDAPADEWQIGVPACDAYVSGYLRCIDDHFPEPARDQIKAAVKQSVDAWRQVAKTANVELLPTTCGTALATAKKATESFGCSWPDEPAVSSASAPSGELRRRAEAIRRRAAKSGTDFEALGQELQEAGAARFVGELGPTSLAQMPASLAAGLRSLRPGQVSDVLVDADGVTIIKVLRTWPAGTLPLEAVRDRVEFELLEASYTEGRQALRRELAERYPVRAETPVAVDAAKSL